ncbi:hypothetical protein SynSYN20_01670 [Synechococcus sp. SYN20]|uniref:hypothetical protein n=1 Tax=Synechococcus sp. SYN20 TaxID=1050714 RepID=UPI001645FB4C|nr:hypothetical protein [Synechococcus sp. SYN20]QNJ25997.1 hypothetical protein SynSYN20_01670 [Synechococcus sp. SYN20]
MTDFIARIKPKRSTVSGEVPAPTDLELAELAVNTADGVLFTKHTDGTIKSISGGGGSGGGTIESIGNVEPRQVATSYASWNNGESATSAGGWFYDIDASSTLTLNKEDANGDLVTPYVSTLPASGTFWWSNDDINFLATAYSNLAINGAAGLITFDVVELPGIQSSSTLYVAWADPYSESASFDGDLLVFDATKGQWVPTSAELSVPNKLVDLDDVDLTPTELVDDLPVVWDGSSQTFKADFPLLSIDPQEGARSFGGSLGLLGPSTFYGIPQDAVGDGWTDLNLTGDDRSHRLQTPADLVGVVFYGKPIPAEILFDTNGALYWGVNAQEISFIGGGDIRDDADRGSEFFLALWSQDTQARATFEQFDGTTWTLRLEQRLPYNSQNGVPVEVSFKTDGTIRVIYGSNSGSDIQLGSRRQGIVIDDELIVGGWSYQGDGHLGNFTWETFKILGGGRGIEDLSNVSRTLPAQGEVLQWDENFQQFRPGPVLTLSDSAPIVDQYHVIAEEDVIVSGNIDEGTWGIDYGIIIFGTQNPSIPVDDLRRLQPGDELTFTKDGFPPFNVKVDQAAQPLLSYSDVEYVDLLLQAPAELSYVAGVAISSPRFEDGATDGQATQYILQWHDSDQKYKTAELRLPEAAVGSVNEQTGEVSLGIQDMNDVLLPGGNLSDGDILKWNNGLQSFVGAQLPEPSVNLDDLEDVDLATTLPTDRQVLGYDAASQGWKPLTVAFDDEIDAIEAWVEAKGYATETWTESFVDAQDFATEAWVDLWLLAKNYATKTWVTDKNYAAQVWVENKNYATESWVENKTYATEAWVEEKSYATEVWVEEKSYASETWVEEKSYATETWVQAEIQAEIGALQAEVLTLQDQLETKIDPAPQDGSAYVRQDGQWLSLAGVLAALGFQPGGGGGPQTPDVPEVINGGDFSTGAAGSVDLTLAGGNFTTGSAGNSDATLDGGNFSGGTVTASGGDFTTGAAGGIDASYGGGDFSSGAPGQSNVTLDGGFISPDILEETLSGGDFTSGVGGTDDRSFGGGDFRSGQSSGSDEYLDGGVFSSGSGGPSFGGGDFGSGGSGGPDVTLSGGNFSSGESGSTDITLDGGVLDGGGLLAGGGDFISGGFGGPDITYGGGDFSAGGSGSEDVTLDGGFFEGDGLTTGGGDFTAGGSGGPDVTYGGGDFSTGGPGSGDVNLDGGDFGGPEASGGDFTSGQSGDDNSTYGAGDFSTGTSSGESVTMDGGDFTAEGGGDFTSGGAGGADVTFGAGDFTSGESSGAAVEMDGGDFSS